MTTALKLNGSGAAIASLQQDLARCGFTPGPIDGVFGMATDAALRAFQVRAGLAADGLAGPATLAALEAGPRQNADITVHVTPGMVSRMFPRTPLAHIQANLPPVLTSLRDVGLGDKTMVLMALATIRAETASFLPVSEGVSRYNTSGSGEDFDLYDDRRDLGNRGAPDGQRFRGRGFVQLTGRANYRIYGLRLGGGLDLTEYPEMANDPPVAAALLALFLKDKEAPLRAAATGGDLARARRLVNGGAHGLSDFTQAWTIGQRVLPVS